MEISLIQSLHDQILEANQAVERLLQTLQALRKKISQKDQLTLRLNGTDKQIDDIKQQIARESQNFIADVLSANEMQSSTEGMQDMIHLKDAQLLKMTEILQVKLHEMMDFSNGVMKTVESQDLSVDHWKHVMKQIKDNVSRSDAALVELRKVRYSRNAINDAADVFIMDCIEQEEAVLNSLMRKQEFLKATLRSLNNNTQQVAEETEMNVVDEEAEEYYTQEVNDCVPEGTMGPLVGSVTISKTVIEELRACPPLFQDPQDEVDLSFEYSDEIEDDQQQDLDSSSSRTHHFASYQQQPWYQQTRRQPVYNVRKEQKMITTRTYTSGNREQQDSSGGKQPSRPTWKLPFHTGKELLLQNTVSDDDHN